MKAITYEELKEKIDQLKEENFDKIATLVVKNAPPIVTSDVQDKYSRLTSLYCPVCGVFGEYNENQAFCSCGQMLNKDRYTKNTYGTLVFNDSATNDLYVVSTTICPEFEYDNNHRAYVKNVEYYDIGYGLFGSSSFKKTLYTNDGKRKSSSAKVFRYSELFDINGVGSIWGESISTSGSSYGFWYDVDSKCAKSSSSSAAKQPANYDILFKEDDNMSVVPILFSEVSHNRVDQKIHFECWCRKCNTIFETDLEYDEEATCPNCGTTSFRNTYSSRFVQVNANGDDIDIVKYSVGAEDFDITVQQDCAYKITSKGKTTGLLYDSGTESYVKTSSKSAFRWGHIENIAIDPALSSYNFEKFKKTFLEDHYRLAMIDMRRWFEACIRSPLIVPNLADDRLAVNEITNNFDALDFRAQTPHDLFRLSAEAWEFVHDNDIDLRSFREIVSAIPGHSEEFYDLVIKIDSCRSDPETAKELFDKLVRISDSDLVEYFDEQKRDGLSENDTACYLLTYLNNREELKLDGLPDLPEHIIISQNQLNKIIRSSLFRYGREYGNDNEKFSEHINEFTLPQIVTASFVWDPGKDLLYCNKNGDLVIFKSDTGEIIEVISPDGSLVKF